MTRQGQFIEDPDGVDLPDVGAAHAEAIKAARQMVAEMVIKGRPIDGEEFLINDDTGKQVARIPLRSAIHLD
jgi:hypothetical protein